MGLLNHIAVNTLYRFFFLILQFLITIFISRLIGPAGLGTYSLILANASALLIFTSLGIPAGLTFHAAKKDISSPSLIKIAFYSATAQFFFIVIIELISWSISGKFLIWPVKYPVEGAFGMLFFLSLMITERYGALYNGHHHLQSYQLQLTLFSLLTLTPLVYWTVSDNQLAESSVIITMILVSLLQMISLGLVFRRLTVNNNTELPASEAYALSGFFNYSMLAWFANSIQFLVYRIDFWILQYFKGDEELGLYALAVRIGQTFWVVPALLSTIILPHMTSVTFDQRILERIIRLTNSINLFLMLIIGLLANILIPWIFGSAFSGTVTSFLILIPGILFFSMHTLLASYFASKNKINYNLQTSIFALVSVTILDFLLIPEKGKTGAAMASTIAYTASSIYALMLYVRMEKYSIHRLMIEKQDINWLRENLSRLVFTNKI